jgi:hypothetical protein
MANIGIAVPAVQPWGPNSERWPPFSLPPPPLPTRAVHLRPISPGFPGHRDEAGGLITLTLRWGDTLEKMCPGAPMIVFPAAPGKATLVLHRIKPT